MGSAHQQHGTSVPYCFPPVTHPNRLGTYLRVQMIVPLQVKVRFPPPRSISLQPGVSGHTHTASDDGTSHTAMPGQHSTGHACPSGFQSPWRVLEDEVQDTCCWQQNRNRNCWKLMPESLQMWETLQSKRWAQNRADSTSRAICYASVVQNSTKNEEWCQRGCTKVPQSWNHNYIPIMRGQTMVSVIYKEESKTCSYPLRVGENHHHQRVRIGRLNRRQGTEEGQWTWHRWEQDLVPANPCTRGGHDKD